MTVGSFNFIRTGIKINVKLVPVIMGMAFIVGVEKRP